MMPIHPCFECLHRSVEECDAAARNLPARARVLCERCGHACRSLLPESFPALPRANDRD